MPPVVAGPCGAWVVATMSPLVVVGTSCVWVAFMKPPAGCAGALTERVKEVDLTLPGVEARSCDDDEAAKRRAIAKAVRAEAAWSSCVAITMDACC